MERRYVILLAIILKSVFAQGITWTAWLEDAKFCENEEVGFTLGTLEATSSSGGSVIYEIITTQFQEFAQLQSTGKLVYQGGFDREAQSSMTVQFRATSATNPADTEVKTTVITIKDSNDNKPIFTESTYVGSTLEHPWGSKDILNVHADDQDNSYAATFTYSMDGQSIATVGSNGAISVNPNAIDYEMDRYFTFVVYANNTQKGFCDAGAVVQVSSASVVLNVVDGPDQPPFFEGAPYFAEVLESSPVGTSVFKVSARDLDYGLQWKMEYFLTNTDTQNMFDINKNTGEITSKQVIDRESDTVINNGGIYTMDIMAKEVVPTNYTPSNDVIAYPFNTTTSVTITILDVNDNLPTFYQLADPTNTGNKKNQTYFNATIDEGTANFIAVPNLYIYVQDKDSVQNAQFNLSVVMGFDAFEVFPTIVSNEALVQLRVKDSKLLDYETSAVHNIEIVAVESGQTEQHAYVTIHLNDVNDQTPEFSSAVLQAFVPEGSVVGSEVFVANASDSDSNDFGKVYYTLSDNDMFEIKDNSTGNVTVKATPDRERRNVYYVTLTATDGGGRSSTASLEINILDVNDNSPIFQRTSYSALLQENAEDFILSASLSASDADAPNTPNSNVTYQIIDGEFSDHFRIELGSNGQGVIMVTTPVDLEAFSKDRINCNSGGGFINLTVMAIDNGSPQNNATTMVEISVEDDNDFSPEFENKTYYASIPEKSQYNTEVLQIMATDNDTCSPNNLLDFQINQTTSNAFLIEQHDNLAILRVKDTNLDLEVTPEYAVEVLVIDRGINRKTGTATVHVTLTDVNDKPPVFNESSLSTFSVSEDTPVGTNLIQQVQATDTDTNSDLVYTIYDVSCTFGSTQTSVDENCTDRFSLNETNGILKVNNSLDREHIDTFILQLQVADNNATDVDTQTVNGDLVITIDDVNDNDPKFESSNLRVNEATSNAYVGQVHATDLDFGENANITYAVAKGSEAYVEIGSLTGQIYTVSTDIDREKIFETTGKNVFNVTIIAQDNGLTDQRSTTKTFDIEIVDINDNTPVFDESVQNATISINENEPINTFVYQISASDIDVGDNAKLKYSLVDSDGRNNFNIDIDYGNLTSRTEFDREYLDTHSITVRVEDSATSSRSAETILTIIIGDVDDNEPDFTSLTTREVLAFVNEGVTPQDFFTAPTAHDQDLPENSLNSYYIVGGSGNATFIVDKSSGTLSAAVDLDRETWAEYDLVLWVSSDSNAAPSKTLTWNEAQTNASMLHVLITVTDVNDNPPAFSSANYEADMPFGTQPAETAVVFQLSATDADIGVNAELVYSLTNIVWVTESNETVFQDRFAVQPSTGNIYLATATDADPNGYYRVDASVSDGLFSDSTTVTIRIVNIDPLVLYSTLTKSEFESQEEEFLRQLKAMLNAEVFVDNILPHEKTNEEDGAQIDVYIHARQSNSTELIPNNEIITAINEDAAFRAEFGISGFKTVVEKTTDISSLKAGLVIACAIFILVVAIFGIATYCITRKYNRRIKVSKTTERAAAEIIDMQTRGQTNVLPGANQFAESGNPLYDDQHEIQIPSWPINSESNDDDSIDDNAVDNQDSAIESEDKPREEEQDDNLHDENFEIDFNPQKDNERLTAALNAAHRGEDNLQFLFDELEDKEQNFV